MSALFSIKLPFPAMNNVNLLRASVRTRMVPNSSVLTRQARFNNFRFQSTNSTKPSPSTKSGISDATQNTAPRMSREEFFEYQRQGRRSKQNHSIHTGFYYFSSIIVAFGALSYAAVPLYRAICQRTGFGGIPITDQAKFTPDKLVPVKMNKRIRIAFSSEVSGVLPWKFTPQQREVYVLPGETALAFYKAKNFGDKDIIGMATYSVTPDKAAQYFSKIQCFCFEEQKLNAGEEVDMPVFFFIDPDFADDPEMRNIGDIVLHYTFFKAQYDERGTLEPVATAAAGGLPATDTPAAAL
ncbi:hypothetical protein NADFUDRAFT_84505 [Nadsonia fulvescens var. elongata DSM 6958]|uniref:Uncharacterized protein n=1 Tax=Nadsonia fulvescens var. elongata DSM 6958 TaxID=857566 RepID=A0A1E3PDS5_9ASCO|nr:hypothetical protein NADFUDRAFT_84505 [Nadsonia fulvescens var. elongata DSM 6958]